MTSASMQIGNTCIQPHAELHPVPVKSPCNHIGIDFVGPLVKSKSENQYILTVCDYCKWVMMTNFHTSEIIVTLLLPQSLL